MLCILTALSVSAGCRRVSLHVQSDAASSVAEAVGVESSAPSEAHSQAQGPQPGTSGQPRRLSRQQSIGSEGGLSDGGHSVNSGGGPHSMGSQSGVSTD